MTTTRAYALAYQSTCGRGLRGSVGAARTDARRRRGKRRRFLPSSSRPYGAGLTEAEASRGRVAPRREREPASNNPPGRRRRRGGARPRSPPESGAREIASPPPPSPASFPSSRRSHPALVAPSLSLVLLDSVGEFLFGRGREGRLRIADYVGVMIVEVCCRTNSPSIKLTKEKKISKYPTAEKSPFSSSP